MLSAMLRLTAKIDLQIKRMNEEYELYGNQEYTYPITRQYYTSVVDPDLKVIVNQEDFEKALDALVPSVSVAELKSYEQLKKKFTVLEM